MQKSKIHHPKQDADHFYAYDEERNDVGKQSQIRPSGAVRPQSYSNGRVQAQAGRGLVERVVYPTTSPVTTGPGCPGGSEVCVLVFIFIFISFFLDFFFSLFFSFPL